MEDSLKTRILASRVDEITAREKILADLRTLNLGQRTTRDLCEKELGYTLQETRSILAQLGLIITSDQMTTADPMVNEKIDKLREWRTSQARRAGVPAYRILSNRVIMEIAKECPKSEASLMAVKGVGQKTARACGPEILQLLHC